jgi:hypothetical protein
MTVTARRLLVEQTGHFPASPVVAIMNRAPSDGSLKPSSWLRRQDIKDLELRSSTTLTSTAASSFMKWSQGSASFLKNVHSADIKLKPALSMAFLIAGACECKAAASVENGDHNSLSVIVFACKHTQFSQ